MIEVYVTSTSAVLEPSTTGSTTAAFAGFVSDAFGTLTDDTALETPSVAVSRR